jgi:hypothetical protein
LIDPVVCPLYVIRVDGMTQANAISEKCCSQKHGVMAEGDARPQPSTDIEYEQNTAHRDDPAAKVIGSIVE